MEYDINKWHSLSEHKPPLDKIILIHHFLEGCDVNYYICGKLVDKDMKGEPINGLVYLIDVKTRSYYCYADACRDKWMIFEEDK